VRIEGERDIGSFVERASAIELNSWQYRVVGPQISTSQDECERLTQLANHGIFRSYLLRCGDLYCAFLKGFQYGGVYYASWCGFDQGLAELSPGKALWYFVIRDLFDHSTPKRLNFFWGDAWYKKLFATETLVGSTTVLVPRRRRAVTRMCFRTMSTLRQLRGAARKRLAVSGVCEHTP
jgi:CelD/BcsL family acetyltransferase involved in cellulose biosynthesis